MRHSNIFQDIFGHFNIQNTWYMYFYNFQKHEMLQKFLNKEKSLPGPISQHHGTADGVLPFFFAQQSAEFFKKVVNKEEDFQFFSYEGMEHSSCLEELQNVNAFVKKCLKL